MAMNGLGSLIKGLKESHAPHTFMLYLSTLLFIISYVYWLWKSSTIGTITFYATIFWGIIMSIFLVDWYIWWKKHKKDTDKIIKKIMDKLEEEKDRRKS